MLELVLITLFYLETLEANLVDADEVSLPCSILVPVNSS